MRPWKWIALWTATTGFMLPAAVLAQGTANPVVSSAREIVTRQSKFIVAAAEEMPADKYSFHPSADQSSFGKIIAHVTQANNGVCAMLGATPAAQTAKVTETDSKEALIAALKSSLDFCDQALANLQDAKLGDTITFFRGAQEPRARALLELTDDLEDHYSQMASYLRLNGLTPPSAQPRK